MSPAADAKKSSSAKPNKLGGKEFEETFKPKNNAKDAEDKGGKKDKKKKSRFPLTLIIIIAIVVLLGGSVTFLYLSGNLNKIFNTALHAVGLQVIQSSAVSPSATAGASASPDAAGASASPEAGSGITPAPPSPTATHTTSPAASPEPSVSPGATDTAAKTFEELKASFSDEKLAELKQVGTIYSKMDPKAAADIMAKIYNPEQIAVIIYNMQPAASALVLAKMDTALAANVTKLLTS